MVETSQELKRDRTRSAIAVAAIHLALGYVLVTGLGFELPPALGDELKLFDVPPPPPLPKEPPPPAGAADLPADAPAPPNLRAEPTPVVAPPPAVRLDPLIPIVAAPVAGVGSAASAGAVEVKGPGTGAGGTGSGRGGGGEGSGAGRTGGGAEPILARKLSGALIPFRLPRSVLRADLGADITFRIAVGPDGRVAACSVERMTGAADIGPYACRAIQERYRYEPARDAEGKAVGSVMFENHAWGVERRR